MNSGEAGRRLSSEEGGGDGDVDLLFVVPPPDDLSCPICLRVQTEPVLTSCCGNHFCSFCMEQVIHKRRPCPLCNSQSFTTMLDKHFGRKVNDLQVWCQHRKMGCPWQGSISSLRRHVDSKSGDCKFMKIDCPYFCSTPVYLSELELHKTMCPNRPHICKFCGYSSTYDNMRAKHWSVCDNYPLPCPNNCGQFDIPRRDLHMHLQECMENHDKCEFAYAGCSAHMKRGDMAEHLASNLQEHLNLVSRYFLQAPKHRSLVKEESKDDAISFLQSKLKETQDEVTMLRAKVEYLEDEIDDVKTDCLHLRSFVFVPPFEFIMTEFRRHMMNKEQWLSPSFYSSIGGYKMCISVDANGSEEGQDTHISVYVNLMKGEYDDHLQWPYKGSIFIELSNQRQTKSGVGNWQEKIMFTYDASSIASRVVDGVLAEEGLGIPTFIEHSRLSFDAKKNTEYLKDDCLRFKIVRIE